MKKVSIHFKIH